MSYFIYVIYSISRDKYYFGQTDNIDNRLFSHNSGKSPYTSSACDWKLVYSETFQTRSESRKRENEIKRKKSRKYIEWIVSASSDKSRDEGVIGSPESFRDDTLHQNPG